MLPFLIKYKEGKNEQVLITGDFPIDRRYRKWGVANRTYKSATQQSMIVAAQLEKLYYLHFSEFSNTPVENSEINYIKLSVGA